MPPSKRKDDLHRWVEHDLKERFQKRIIDIDLRVAKTWGKIQAQSEAQGDPLPAIVSARARRAGLPAIDSLIAATGIAHNLTVVSPAILPIWRQAGSHCSTLGNKKQSNRTGEILKQRADGQVFLSLILQEQH